MKFSRNLEDNLFRLYYTLKHEKYQHGSYESFFVFDPKKRHIHKAAISDRVLHHATVRIVEPVFNSRFIFDSHACRKEKGVHVAVGRFQKFAWLLSRNNTKTVWALKCDIASFFNTVDHQILMSVLGRTIKDEQTRRLLWQIIDSFCMQKGRGLPLGNLTSQLFANVYLNELDQFIKNVLRAKYYIRYCDDFIILDRTKERLSDYIGEIDVFLRNKLKLQLHPKKVFIKKYHQGIDFLGFICFPHFRLLRTNTKKRMLRKLTEYNPASFNSYLGLVKHCRSRGLRMEMIKKIVYNNNNGGKVPK